MHQGHSVTASVTGKPVDVGGSEGRVDAPGRGATYLTLEALKYLHIDEETPTVAVQGYGQVGRSTTRLLSEAGLPWSRSATPGGRRTTPKASTWRRLRAPAGAAGASAGSRKPTP